ncbi:MAG: zinc-binding dehydrogenase [Verrucomicrobiota bacterium]
MKASSAMKAIQFSRFGGPEVLEYVDVPAPIPAAGEVLIEVAAAGVNYPDIRERLGVYNRAETKVGGVVLPRITGLQAAGVVREVGSQGDRSLLGKKVLAMLTKGGGYAQFVTAPSVMSVPLSDGADDVTMAALPCQGLTAWLTLQASTELRPGESVLVQGGAGGVGSLAIQIAKILGAGKVIATAGTEEKRAFTRSLGADFAVDYELADWPKAVLEQTGGRGVDVILESIGGEVFEQNFQCLAPFGRCIIFGSTRGPGKPFEPRRLMTKAQTLTGLYLPFFFQKPELVRRGLEFLVAHALDGSLRAQVARVLPLSQTAEAHRLLEDRKVTGILVLDPRG